MSEDEAIARLREALGPLAAAQAPKLLAEAEATALARAQEVLTEEITESLLVHSRDLLREAPDDAPARRLRSGQSEQSTEEGRSGRYVYGIVYADARLPDGLVGVNRDRSPSRIEEGGLAAIASEVSLSEFGEESLRQNLNDVAWLEEKARAHEAVLEAALREGTVVPLRLCTIYIGEEDVREMLRREGPLLLDALERLKGKTEWGVKAIADEAALQRAAMERCSATPEAEASEGRAYLNRKRREATVREVEDEIADEWARAVHAPLVESASEALLNPLQRPEVCGHDGEMILNGVYLVEDREAEGFGELVRRLAEESHEAGLRVELTGPWPPYNFVKSSIESAR